MHSEVKSVFARLTPTEYRPWAWAWACLPFHFNICSHYFYLVCCIYTKIYMYMCVCAMCAIVRLLVSVSNIEIYSLVRCVHPLRLLFMHPFFFGSTNVPSSIWLGMRYVKLVVDGGVTLMRDTHNKMIIITILYILL